MAEFCVDCWNKIMDTNDPPRTFHLSWELDFCEECGQLKRVIICVKKRYIFLDWVRECIARIRSKS